MILVAQGIHGLPEAGVTVGGKLTVAGQALHRLTLPERSVAVDEVDDVRGQHEEPAIDPGTVALGLLLEALDLIAVEVERAETPRRLDGGE